MDQTTIDAVLEVIEQHEARTLAAHTNCLKSRELEVADRLAASLATTGNIRALIKALPAQHLDKLEYESKERQEQTRAKLSHMSEQEKENLLTEILSR